MSRTNWSLVSMAGLALLAGGANAAPVSVIVGTDAASNYHTYMEAGGSNGAAPVNTYGDGATTGVSPGNICLDGTTLLCSDENLTKTPTIAANQFINGNNGNYWTNSTPVANYAGSTLTYDNAITFVDSVDGLTYYRITGGALAWTGTYGFEVTVAATANPGGSFFGYAFNNGTVNLSTGARTGTSSCYLGAAGNEVVGALLCAVQPISSYAYANVGTAYTKSANWAGIRFDAAGGAHLLLTSARYSQSGSGNNIREELNLHIVPVPAAVWLFGSAVGLMGVMRRRKATV